MFERDPRRQCNNILCVCVCECVLAYGHGVMRRFGRDADRVDGRGGVSGAERGGRWPLQSACARENSAAAV